MSQKTVVIESDATENVNQEPEATETVEKEQIVEEEQKMEVDPVVVRRQSQNSENNDGTDNVTPVQTDDNDEVYYSIKKSVFFLIYVFRWNKIRKIKMKMENKKATKIERSRGEQKGVEIYCQIYKFGVGTAKGNM